MNVPTAKQSMRSIIVKLFPWIGGVVSVVGAKGKGLAIRTASGLLHLAGGPDDPAVHRVGDFGTAGSWSATANTLTHTAVDNSITTFTFAIVSGAIAITKSPPTPLNQATKATTGSERVTCS